MNPMNACLLGLSMPAHSWWSFCLGIIQVSPCTHDKLPWSHHPGGSHTLPALTPIHASLDSGADGLTNQSPGTFQMNASTSFAPSAHRQLTISRRQVAAACAPPCVPVVLSHAETRPLEFNRRELARTAIVSAVASLLLPASEAQAFGCGKTKLV